MSKQIVVLLNRQILIAYENGAKVFEFHCATGDENHATDVGRFKIFRKHRAYTSRKYNVPMDYAMFFTYDGKAIHKSHMVFPISILKYFGFNSFGSRGCVRLSDEDARKLFDWTPMGTTVEVRYV